MQLRLLIRPSHQSWLVALVHPKSQTQNTRRSTHCMWFALIQRIRKMLPLICPMCGSQMGLIAFINFNADIHKIQGRLMTNTNKLV